MKQESTKSTAGWIMSFAGRKKSLYISSMLLAALGVLCSIAPYVIMGNLIGELIGGNQEWSYFLTQGGIMAAFWLVRIILHSVSTTCSHVATFHVLAEIRKDMCDKLSKLPLGFVKDTPSGSLKNIMVERLDSVETTLAHILPEFTGNLLAPLCVFIYMLTIDWRMALISLITLPLALLC